MAMLAVYEYPHPILKQKAVKVDKVDDELRHFLDDMLETMYESAGVGLAAPQVGVSKRIVVIDAEQEDDGNGHKAGNPMYLVNPEIIWRSEEMVCGERDVFLFRSSVLKLSAMRRCVFIIWIMTARNRKF